jgi:hypothetical protein
MVQTPDNRTPELDDRTMRSTSNGVGEIRDLMSLNNQPGDQPPYALRIVDTINGPFAKEKIVERSGGLLEPAVVATLIGYVPEIVFDSRVVKMPTRHVYPGGVSVGAGLGGAMLFDYSEFLTKSGQKPGGDSIVKFFQTQLIAALGLHVKAAEITGLALDVLEMGDGDEGRAQRISFLRNEFPVIAEKAQGYVANKAIPAILPIARMPEPETEEVEGTQRDNRPAATRQIDIFRKYWGEIDVNYLRTVMAKTANEFGTGMIIAPMSSGTVLTARGFLDAVPGINFKQDVAEAMRAYTATSARYVG